MEKVIKTKHEWVWNEEAQRHDWIDVQHEKFIFTEEDKMKIVSEYYHGKESASSVVERYHLSSKQVLFSWMDKYLHEESLSLPETEPEDPMAKKNPEERVKELEAANKALQKALELEKLRSKAYDTMINVAEEKFNIPIRKKHGTKQ